MRTIFCVLATLMLGLTSLQAQSLKAIKLNAPDKTRGASVMKALADRHSEREETQPTRSFRFDVGRYRYQPGGWETYRRFCLE